MVRTFDGIFIIDVLGSAGHPLSMLTNPRSVRQLLA